MQYSRELIIRQKSVQDDTPYSVESPGRPVQWLRPEIMTSILPLWPIITRSLGQNNRNLTLL